MDMSSIFCLSSFNSFYFCFSLSSYSSRQTLRASLLLTTSECWYLFIVIFQWAHLVFRPPCSSATPRFLNIDHSFCCCVIKLIRYFEERVFFLCKAFIKFDNLFAQFILRYFWTVCSFLFPAYFIFQCLHFVGQELHLLGIVFGSRLFITKQLHAFFLGPIKLYIYSNP